SGFVAKVPIVIVTGVLSSGKVQSDRDEQFTSFSCSPFTASTALLLDTYAMSITSNIFFIT
ncbi:TPA: hypothetical protein ACXRZN_004699, partial [Klebsiella variicola subsp. variicola]